ncbi:MAG: hypothetical protein ACUVXI_15225 [bacterium]
MIGNPQSAGTMSRVGAPFDLIPRHVKSSTLPSLVNQRFGREAWAVLSELIQLDCRFNPHLPGEFFRTHSEISQATGLSRKTLSKYFSSFLKGGILSFYSPGHNGRASTFRLPDTIPLLDVAKTNPRQFYRYAETFQDFLERTTAQWTSDPEDLPSPPLPPRDNPTIPISQTSMSDTPDTLEERIRNIERKIDAILSAISSPPLGEDTEGAPPSPTGGSMEGAPHPDTESSVTDGYTTRSSVTNSYAYEKNILDENRHREKVETENAPSTSKDDDDEITKLYSSILPCGAGCEPHTDGKNAQFLREMVRKFGRGRVKACLSLPYLREYIARARNPRGYLYHLLSDPERNFVREWEMEKRGQASRLSEGQIWGEIESAIESGCRSGNPLVREVYEDLRERKPATKWQWKAAVGEIVRLINDRLTREACSRISTGLEPIPPGGTQSIWEKHARRLSALERAGIELLDADDFPWPLEGARGRVPVLPQR